MPGREDTELIVRLLSSTGVVAAHGLLMPVVVSQTFTSWNRIADYLRRLDGNSSLFPTALESPRGFTREPKVITTE